MIPKFSAICHTFLSNERNMNTFLLNLSGLVGDLLKTLCVLYLSGVVSTVVSCFFVLHLAVFEEFDKLLSVTAKLS